MKNKTHWILKIGVFFFLVLIIILLFVTRKKKSSRTLSSDNMINYDFGYTKHLNPTITFNGTFQMTPIVLSNVINVAEGGEGYDGSSVAIQQTDTTQFVPNVYQSWPIMGINWAAFPPDSPIFETRTLTINDMKIAGNVLGFVTFQRTYTTPPIVICTPNSPTMGNFQISVGSVRTTDFIILFQNISIFPTNGINILVIPRDIDTDSLPFDLQFGTIDSTKTPILNNWANAVSFPKRFQYKPILLGTPFYHDGATPAPKSNVTFDSISRQAFHINVQNGWPKNGGVNWVAFARKSPLTSKNYPIHIISDYILYEPSKSLDEKYFVINFDSTHRPGLDDSCIIANGIDILHAESANQTTIPEFPFIHVVNLTDDRFICRVNEKNNWPKGGIKYIRFSRDAESTMDQFHEPYIIDLGIFDNDAFPDSHHTSFMIPFNFQFPAPPKILTCYHGFMNYETNSSIAITAVYTTHFVFTWGLTTLPNRLVPEFPIHWVAIYENPTSTQHNFPYPIQINQFSSLNDIVNTQPHSQPDNFSSLNDIFGLIPFSTSFPVQPSISLGCGFLSIDSVHDSFFHVNTVLPEQFMQALFSTIVPITWIIFIDSTVQEKMPFSNCEMVEYVDPTCPTLTTNPTLCNTISVSAYLPLIEYEYLERVSEISTDQASGYMASNDDDTDYQPIVLDNIVICNIHLSYNDYSAWSQYGEICQNQTNHLKNNDPAFTQWGVNTDYGYFSSCRSFGSVLIRINSSFPSYKPISVTFFGNGISPHNRYYVQFGTSYDMIKGPFAYNEYVNLEFGHTGCGAANIYCKIKQLFRNSCKGIIKPFLQVPQNWIQGQACINSLAPAVTGVCIGLFGGPEDVIADGACPVFVGYPISSACQAYVNAAEKAEDLDRLLDYDRFAAAICDQL